MASVSDRRVRSFIDPVRVGWREAPAPAGAEKLLTDSIGQAIVGRKPACVLSKGCDGKSDTPFLLVDFGQELHGGLQLVTGETSDRRTVAARIRFGESVSEAVGQPDQNHAIHDHHVRLPWYGQHELGNTGFRFASIELTEAGSFVELQGLRAVSLMDPAAWVGAFQCDDERLNQIWQVAARTVHLCMQNYLWDGIKRDRLVWAGDVHPEVMAILNVFGHHPVVEESLDLLRDHTPLPGRWMNDLPTYSLWWLITWRDWWFHTGRLDRLKSNSDYILTLSRAAIALVDESGDDQLPARFLDWAIAGRDDELKAGSHALVCLALEAGAQLCEVLGQSAEAVLSRQAANRMRKFTVPFATSLQANALRVLAKMEDATEINQARLAANPYTDLSPFYAYYVLEARAMAGDIAGCLSLIKDYWGAMLDLGSTSFWEHFDMRWLKSTPAPGRIDEWPTAQTTDLHRTAGAHCYQGWRHSLCHGWGAGPVAWLGRHVLGVTVLSPGCGTISVQPQMGHLRRVEGRFPTPLGPVEILHERLADDQVKSIVRAPDGVTVVNS